jgi:hypothetical protein
MSASIQLIAPHGGGLVNLLVSPERRAAPQAASAAIVIDTEQTSPERAADQIIAYLQRAGYLSPTSL